MKLRFLITALLITAIACPFVRAEGGKDTPLEKQMKMIGRAFKQLRKQAGDAAQNTSSLQLVTQMEKAAATAAGLVPSKASDLPEKDRAGFTADYKKKMEDFAASLTKVEAALKAGDNATAAKLVAELGGKERAGHKEFRRPQD